MSENFQRSGRLMFADVYDPDISGVPASAVAPRSFSRESGSRFAFQNNTPSRSHRVLGIDPVLHSTQQVLNFARADLCFRIVQRNGAAETVLRMFQPGPPLINVAEKVCGLAK